jgi:hypothetical protein
MTPNDIRIAIVRSPAATMKVLEYLDRLGHEHRGRISGSALAAVCGVSTRSWRKWAHGDRRMPAAAWRLLVRVSGLQLTQAEERAPEKPAADEDDFSDDA